MRTHNSAKLLINLESQFMDMEKLHNNTDELTMEKASEFEPITYFGLGQATLDR